MGIGGGVPIMYIYFIEAGIADGLLVSSFSYGYSFPLRITSTYPPYREKDIRHGGG